ncbi:hypothetical protein [Streptomyces sp. NL15-2K]|uniref:hypothetical protein n=1 Tax=Streptomyces sp. NL15-2K TaxID=376149 RepID=UPI000F587E43|nr:MULTISPECIES: hypothetical protein [Actinomycetes]WKX10037.1 hypothetical protein Q4V64_22085 [Kutzneria buriramensis]
MNPAVRRAACAGWGGPAWASLRGSYGATERWSRRALEARMLAWLADTSGAVFAVLKPNPRQG